MPIPLGLILGGTQLASGILGAFGQLDAAQKQKEAADRQANNITYTSQFRVIDIEKTRIRRLSEQRASYGARGVTLSGSPLEIAAETNELANLDKARVKYQARTQADEIRKQADAATQGAQLAAIGNVIGGAVKGTSAYMQLKGSE